MVRASRMRHTPVLFAITAGAAVAGLGLTNPDAQAVEASVQPPALAPVASPDQLLAALPDTFSPDSITVAAFRAAASGGVGQAATTPGATSAAAALLLATAPAATAPSTPASLPEAPANPPGTTPSGWYTPVAKYYFSARFGVSGPWQSGHHTGLDFVTRLGTPIRAATDGVVVSAGPAGAYGNLVEVKIAPGLQIWMAHMESIEVKVGQRVKAGEVIGHVGVTGNTTGPHCHFEVRKKGTPVDPEPYFWPNGHSVTRQK